jgi:peptide/nickel transport system substrate-binding protein
MKRVVSFMIIVCVTMLPLLASGQEKTSVGTLRSETVVFQTFNGKSPNPDQHNPLMAYNTWHGFRELGMGYLWETDTGTGEYYPELAAEMPETLNDERTKFRIKLKQGIYWSDGVEFTADDVIYTLETYFTQKDKLTNGGVATITRYLKGYEKVDTYTLDVETVQPSYRLNTQMGVYTWGSSFNIVPKHIFEKEADISKFRNTYPVTIGPFILKEFDPNGFWALWERRDDWQRSAWGWMGDIKPKYVLLQDFGPEEKRVLAMVQNQYDVDTFMSPDSIKAAQKRSAYVKTFSPNMPYHNMDDACGYGVMINQLKSPFDQKEVRWALALATDLKAVSINALNGEVKVSPLPMVDTQILRPIYFTPILPFLREFALDDGYKPFDENFAKDFAEVLKQMGLKDIPEGDEALSEAFGIGWWKHDPEQAAKLLEQAGMKKNKDGNWTLADGTVWEPQLVIPGDWNKVMQRMGFSIADSWRKFGIKVNARQADSAERQSVMNHNNQLEAVLTWYNCVFTPDYARAWRTTTEEYLTAPDSGDRITGNGLRWKNATVNALAGKLEEMDPLSEESREAGRTIMKEAVKDMPWIGLMNIPTTVPTNDYYWTNWPKQDNYYAVPYSWWSSVKSILTKLEPTGRTK